MSEWQPINTAPQDGTWIWAVNEFGGQDRVRWFMGELCEGWHVDYSNDYGLQHFGTATHWMPLPEAPR